MKKSLKKVIVTFAAVAALSAAMAATAMAATTQTTVDGKTTLTYETTATANEQVTVLVLKPTAVTSDGISAEEIAYIDQKAADTEGKVSFTMPLGATTAGATYSLMSGSETATTVKPDDVVIAGTTDAIHYGDLNNDNEIGSIDAGLLIKWAAGKMDLAKDEYLERMCISVPDYNDAGSTDALYILKWAAGKTSSFDSKFEWELAVAE